MTSTLRALMIAAPLALSATTLAAQDLEFPFDPDAPFDAADFDVENGKAVWESRGNCLECHGWDGNNRMRNPRAPGPTPNLRETPLDAVLLYEVIACGRPGTAMPYHLRGAYDDGRCFGLTMADFEEGEAPEHGNLLRPDAMADLVAYMLTDIVGAGETTLAQCEEFYRPGHRNCRGLE